MKINLVIDDTDIVEQLNNIVEILTANFSQEKLIESFLLWLFYNGITIDSVDNNTVKNYRESYAGFANNKAEFAKTMYSDLYGDLEPTIERYFNWDMFAKDLFLDDLYKINCDNGIYVFRRL